MHAKIYQFVVSVEVGHGCTKEIFKDLGVSKEYFLRKEKLKTDLKTWLEKYESSLCRKYKKYTMNKMSK